MLVPSRYWSHRSKARSTVSDTRSSASSRTRESLKAKLYSASRWTSASDSKSSRDMTKVRGDEALQVVTDVRHHLCVALHSREQHSALDCRHDELRKPFRFGIGTQPVAHFAKQRGQCCCPLLEHLVE